MRHFLLYLLFISTLLLASLGCEGANYCGDLVYDQVQNTCVCPEGSMPNYDLDLCEFPSGEVIPWEEFDVPYRDTADASTDMGISGDAGTDAITPDTSVAVDAGTDMPVLDIGTDVTVDAGPAPTAPRPFYPWNGLSTGSMRIPLDAPIATHPLQPRFRWAESDDTEHYQIQLTRECELSGFRRCPFTEIDTDTTTVATTFRPAEALAVQMTAPVGDRYFWRVRACNAGGCSPWSEIRYVDVGRDSHDINGDGYSDIVVAAKQHDAPQRRSGAVYVYLGSDDGASITPSLTLTSPTPEANGAFGTSLSYAGDLNGDGFTDLLVGASAEDGGAVHVFFGGEPPILAGTIDAFTSDESTAFGWSVSGAGDLNADGYADIVIGAESFDSPADHAGAAFILFGNPEGIPDSQQRLNNPLDQEGGAFGWAVSGAGDTNGDGYPDILISAWQQDAPEENEGSVYLYRGGAAGPSVIPSLSLDNPADEMGGLFGTSLGAGDINGDGFSDVLVGAAFQDGSVVDEGAVFIYLGGEASISTSPSISARNPEGQIGAVLGVSLGSGDFNGDGFDDFVVGAMQHDSPALDEGSGYLFFGQTTGISEPTQVDNPRNQPDGQMGRAAAAVGDVDADGYCDYAIGAWYQNAPERRSGAAYLFRGAAIPGTLALSLSNPDHQETGEFGGSISN